LCFVILDLDHFKRVNDQHGHDAGDQVLRQFGALLQQTFRSADVVARWGSEVCCGFICCDSSSELGAEFSCSKLHQQEFTSASGEKFRVTFSGGIAEYPEKWWSWKHFIEVLVLHFIGPRRRRIGY